MCPDFFVTHVHGYSDRVEQGIAEAKWKFERNVSVVGFFKKTGASKDFLTLKKERGELSDGSLNQRLRESRLIAFDLMIVEYKDRKFLDHMPPLPYILQILWDDLFNQYAADIPKDELKGWAALTVTVEKITADLQEYYGFKSSGARSPGIPRAKWVRKALDTLVAFKMAEPESEGQYLIKYKRTYKDTLERFGRLCFKLEQLEAGKKRKSSSNETPLLPGLTA